MHHMISLHYSLNRVCSSASIDHQLAEDLETSEVWLHQLHNHNNQNFQSTAFVCLSGHGLPG
jgi:hypothetical protein